MHHVIETFCTFVHFRARAFYIYLSTRLEQYFLLEVVSLYQHITCTSVKSLGIFCHLCIVHTDIRWWCCPLFRSPPATQTPAATLARSWNSPSRSPWFCSSLLSAGSHFTSSTASRSFARTTASRSFWSTSPSSSLMATRLSTPLFTLSASRSSARPLGKSGNCTCSARIPGLGSLKGGVREDWVMSGGSGSKTTTTTMCDLWQLAGLYRNCCVSLFWQTRLAVLSGSTDYLSRWPDVAEWCGWD